jgi:Kef-type K+ transport system membrane component KefB
VHTALELLPLLALMLIGAKLAGLTSRYVGLPAVFGELLLGLFIGPSLLNLIQPDAVFDLIGEIGVIVLIFMAGIETEIDELQHVGWTALLTALGGVILPLGGGYGLGLGFGLHHLHALFLGAVLTATSVSISAQVLRELGWLRSTEGVTILGAAIIDDVLAVLVLSIVLAFADEGSFWTSLGRMLIFFPVAWIVGHWLVPRLMRAEQRIAQKETSVAVLLGILLFYAWSAEALGAVAAITGAYLLGIIVIAAYGSRALSPR